MSSQQPRKMQGLAMMLERDMDEHEKRIHKSKKRDGHEEKQKSKMFEVVVRERGGRGESPTGEAGRICYR